MNIAKLKTEFPKLVCYMNENGYSSSHLTKITVEFNWLIKNGKQFQSYAEALEERIRCSSPKSSGKLRCLFGILQKLEENGEFPDGSYNNPLSIRDSYSKLLSAFRSFVDEYVDSVNNGIYSESTVYGGKCKFSKFLLELQELGCEKLSDIQQEQILEIFKPDQKDPFKDHPKMSLVATILNSMASDEARRIAQLIPPIKRTRKNIQYLNENEATKIHDALFNETNGLCLRDRAIGKLLYFTGMRASDVAGMKISDIDWERDWISLLQKKTSAPLVLPLPAVVGNAISDYLLKERPESIEDCIFLTKGRHPHKMAGVNISIIVNEIFRKAGVRQEKGDRRGAHIFRHRVATHLASSNISRVVISDTLGHTDPLTLDKYLSADIINLRKCALSIEDFPVKEVFHG